MQQRQDWRSLSGQGPEIFERVMVPAVFRPWADDLVATAAVGTGERVLDVACGTGIVARLAAERVGPTGRVVGLDISPGMLVAARAAAPDAAIEWREGSATHLPFPDESFDLVLCQQGLQYFPDRPLALHEMHRILRPGGRVVLSVFHTSPVYRALNQALVPHLGEATAALALEPLALADETELHALLLGAGFPDAAIRRVARVARFPSADGFIQYNFSSRFAAAVAPLTDEARAAMETAARAALGPFIEPDGLAFPMEAHIATGHVVADPLG
jgi:ubiquinone/menaquinone biosynthesis C-methylase UbiE